MLRNTYWIFNWIVKFDIIKFTLVSFDLLWKQLKVFSLWGKILREGRQRVQQLLVGGATRSGQIHPNWWVLIGQWQVRSHAIGCCGAVTLELLESELADEICRGPRCAHTHILTHTDIHSQWITHYWLHCNSYVAWLNLSRRFLSLILCLSLYFSLFILPYQRIPSSRTGEWSQYLSYTKSRSPFSLNVKMNKLKLLTWLDLFYDNLWQGLTFPSHNYLL